MAEIFVVETRGVGKPDYSREISLGRERPGLSLKYKQTLKCFAVTFTAAFPLNPYPIVVPPLAPGATQFIIDFDTGFPMPFTVPIGYTATAVSASFSFTQDSVSWASLDGFVLSNLGVPVAGSVSYLAQIVEWGTAILYPAGATAHTYAIAVTNTGEGNLEGGGHIFVILEEVGTGPLPTTKTVRCKFCEHEKAVPHETQHWVCPRCSQLNIFSNFRQFRRTP